MREGERDERVPFYKLFSFADAKDICLMSVGSVGAIFNGLSMPLMTLLFGQLIDAFAVSTSTDVVRNVAKVSVRFVYLGICTGVASFLQVSCWMVSGERQAARIRGLYLKNILRQDIAFFDKETTTGEVIERLSGDTILIQDAVGEKVGKFIQLLSTFVGGFAVAFSNGWLLTAVMVACIPAIVIPGAALSLYLSKMKNNGEIAYAEAGSVIEQTIGSIRTVVSFTGEKKAITKYQDSLKTPYKYTVQQALVSGIGMGSVLTILFCSYGLAVWYGSKLIIENSYSGGKVVNVMIAVTTGGTSLGQASPSLNAFLSGTAASYKLFKTINRKPEIDAYDKSGLVLEDIQGNIELRDVYFRYPARPDVQVFSGFSIQITKGTSTAVVGESGSGKSTVISLIERFYDPEAGEVLIDGKNLKDFRVGWIREKIGLISQEPILFMTSIRENIAYGKTDATLEEIKTATKLANAANFIDKLPQGLDTMVGEHGTQLSGGQKQRIAIARAILKNPKILLLDEATSALDAESERIVQEALVGIMVNRTTVIVAHRLSSIRNADNIAVVHQGKIIEQGPHSKLIENPEGPYFQLIRLQKGKIESENVSTVSLDKADSAFESNEAEDVSGSKESSPRRSISRCSSEGSSTHSLLTSVGLPEVVSFREDEGIEKKGKAHEDQSGLREVPVRRLMDLNKPELLIILLGLVASAIHGVIMPMCGVLLSSAVKIFFEPAHQLRKDAKFWAMMFVYLGVGCLVSIPMQHYMFGIAGAKLVERIRALTFERVLHQEISWFDDPKNSSGAIGARLSADASAVRSLVGDALALVAQNTATIVAGVVIALITNWRLALIILAIVPLVGLQGFAQMKFLKGFSADAKLMYEEASQVAKDAVSDIRTVASFCAEQKILDLYRRKCEAPKQNGVRRGIISGAGFGFSNLALFCTYALSTYFGARFVENGNTTFPKVFKVLFALMMMAIGVSESSALAPNATKAKESTGSIFAILDRKSKINSSEYKGKTTVVVKGDIEFQNVSFKYPTRPDVQLFKDLCLFIPSGKSFALVGESGCGKSTIIALIERFYDPDGGRILLDGTEIQKFKLKWLRQQMGLVSQEPVLFNDTVSANIAYGKEGAVAEDEIIAAAEVSNVHHFISGLPNGYNTKVGEKGLQLSGGQKQRIAIARAIFKDPKILLLDEATSALDAESEKVVQEALDKVMVKRTTVVVAHRLSTIKGADTIAVVKNGEIAEVGSHEALMKIPDGAYASLVALHVSPPS